MNFIGKRYNPDLTTTEIAKLIRKELKEKFPNCKFSVTTEYFSGGSSITISLMEANFKVIKDFEDIKEEEIQNLGYSKEYVKNIQKERYHQLNQYQLTENNKELCCNGVFLTKEGFDLFKKVVEIANSYNYNKSDITTDYINVNFYLHITIGKWNKPFIQKN